MDEENQNSESKEVNISKEISGLKIKAWKNYYPKSTQIKMINKNVNKF